MGVARCDYVMVGLMASFEELKQKFGNSVENWDKFHEFVHCIGGEDNPYQEQFESDKLKFIFDGMNGEYIIIGFIKDKAVQENGDSIKPRLYNEYEIIDDINGVVNEMHRIFKEHERFKYILELVKDDRVGVVAFTHHH